MRPFRRAPGRLGALLLLTTGLTAAASPAPTTPAALLEAHGIVLVASPGAPRWDEPTLSALAEGLRALPPKLRRFPGGPLELALHRGSAPLGMGDGSEATPDWSDGRRRFHLYRHAETDDRRALQRLRALPPEERERLWRGRALIHAIVTRWDDELGWSEGAAWRDINGWLRPLERLFTWEERALNVYDWAYSRRRGRVSASLDLATFAEELWLPPERLLPGAVPEDERVGCQELSKRRALLEALVAAGLLPRIPERPRCPTFERWASPQTLESIELLRVAPSGRSAESLFGHILLRLVRTPGTPGSAPGLATYVQLVAFTGSDPHDLGYILRGVSGGYRMGVVTLPGTVIAQQMLRHEQRTIHRFRLELDADERLRLLERVWELERRGYFAYHFFNDNCAWLASFLVDGALGPELRVRSPSRLAPLTPGGVLDALELVEVRRPDGSVGHRRLLIPLPLPLDSSEDLARHAEARRDRLMAQLVADAPPGSRARLRAFHELASSPSPGRRLVGYRRLGRLTGALLRRTPEPRRAAVREALHEYLLQSVRIERHGVNVLTKESTEQLLRELGDTLSGPSGPEDVAHRQSAFERESLIQSRPPRLAWQSRLLDELLQAAPEPPSRERRRLAKQLEAQRATFDGLLQLQGALIDRHLTKIEPRAFLDEEARRRTVAGEERLRRSITRSGVGHLSLTLGASLEGRRLRPTLSVSSAAIRQRLGEHRLHGFAPWNAVELFSASVELALGAGPAASPGPAGSPALEGAPVHTGRSELTLVSFRSIRVEPRTRQASLEDALGWGFHARYEHLPSRPAPHAARLGLEALLTLDATEDLSRFTTFGLGIEATLLGLPAGAVLGPTLTVSQRLHLFGSYVNALRLEAAFRPGLQLGGAGWIGEASSLAKPSLGHTLELLLSASFKAGPLALRPGLGLAWRGSGLAPQQAPIPSLTLAVERL